MSVRMRADQRTEKHLSDSCDISSERCVRKRERDADGVNEKALR